MEGGRFYTKTDGIILMLSDTLKTLSEELNISKIFKEYYMIETTYIGLIKKRKFENVITTHKLYELLNDYYYASNNMENIKERRKIEKNIKNIFYSFILNPNFISMVEKLFADESEATFDLDKYSIIRGVHKSFYDKIIKNIQNENSIDLVPNFIIHYEKQLLNYKINEIIKQQFSFSHTEKKQGSPEFKYLKKFWESFNKNPGILFDTNIFGEQLRVKIFHLVILSNYKYIKSDEIKYKIFYDKIINYIIFFKLEDKCKILLEDFENFMKMNIEEVEKKLEKINNEVKKEIFPDLVSGFKDKTLEKENNINKNKINLSEGNSNEEINKKYLQLILFLSVIFNKLIIIKNKKNNNEDSKESKINNNNKENIINTNSNGNSPYKNSKLYEFKLISKLKFSSITRQFLLNILSLFSDRKVFLYNYLLETCIYRDIIHKRNKHLYNQAREKEKILINYDSIKTFLRNYINDKNTHHNTEKFSTFLTENRNIFEQPAFNMGFWGNLFKKEKPEIITNKSGQVEDFYYIKELSFVPILKNETISTQITIVIDGSIDPNILLESTEKILSHKEKFYSFFVNNEYTNSDFYGYDWQSVNYKNIKRSKHVSKFYGKYLAYIIASREIFKFQTINLIGFSMGCNVIKYCLLELNKLNCNEIINNIIFLGGCINLKMEKYPDIFKNVAGKVVNVYSRGDKELMEYNINAIGFHEIKVSKEFEDKCNIINTELSKKGIKQENYFYEIPKILFKNMYLH